MRFFHFLSVPRVCGKNFWKIENELENMTHYTVNHSKEFKNQETGMHTNHIEGTWNGIKINISPRNRTKKDINEHLWFFLWFRKHGNGNWDAMIDTMREVKYK